MKSTFAFTAAFLAAATFGFAAVAYEDHDHDAKKPVVTKSVGDSAEKMNDGVNAKDAPMASDTNGMDRTKTDKDGAHKH